MNINQTQWFPGDRARCRRTEGNGSLIREGRLFYVYDVARVNGWNAVGLFVSAQEPEFVLQSALFTRVRHACNRGLYPNERDV